MSYQLKVKSVDIILITYHREDMLQRTLETLKERTRFPHRIILVDNGSQMNDTLQATIDRTCDIYIKNEAGTTFGPAENLGLEKVETEYVVTTCNDILPPDLEPCWLQRLATLLELNEDYGGINCRAQLTPNSSFCEENDLQEVTVMLQSYLRIQRTEEMRRLGGIPYIPKGRFPYESIGFIKGIRHSLEKKCGTATHIHCNHFGWDAPNKGYPDGVDYEFKVKLQNTWGELDPKTWVQLTETEHKCKEWLY